MNYTNQQIILLLLMITSLSINTSYAQSKLSVGTDVGVRIEKPKFNDPKGYVNRNLLPNSPYGISTTYQANEKWAFELGLYRMGFSRNVNVFYNEPGYQPTEKYGAFRSPSLATLQIPARVIYSTGLGFSKFSLNVFSGLNLYQQVHSYDSLRVNSASGSGVTPEGAPELRFTSKASVIERSSIGLETGVEMKYKLSESFSLAYRFSGILGTRDKIFIEGSYYLTANQEETYSFDYTQNGTAMTHFLSIRYKLP
jgi:hypothetical protein